MRAPGPFGTVVVETVVVQKRAAAPEAAQFTVCRDHRGWQDFSPSREWKLPLSNTLHHILTSPIYAGAYAFGAHRKPYHDRRKRLMRGFRKDRGNWEVLTHNHHEGYINATEPAPDQR